jgi:arylsulfatase A-like enzyme
LCDLPVPDHVEGTSFVPLLENPNRTWKDAIFSRYYNGDSIKTKRYLYTEWHNKNNNRYARMLYDHKYDPKENINIAERPENAELVKELSQRLKKGWKAAVPSNLE